MTERSWIDIIQALSTLALAIAVLCQAKSIRILSDRVRRVEQRPAPMSLPELRKRDLDDFERLFRKRAKAVSRVSRTAGDRPRKLCDPDLPGGPIDGSES